MSENRRGDFLTHTVDLFLRSECTAFRYNFHKMVL